MFILRAFNSSDSSGVLDIMRQSREEDKPYGRMNSSELHYNQGIIQQMGHCIGGNFNIHIWALLGYSIHSKREIRYFFHNLVNG